MLRDTIAEIIRTKDNEAAEAILLSLPSDIKPKSACSSCKTCPGYTRNDNGPKGTCGATNCGHPAYAHL